MDSLLQNILMNNESEDPFNSSEFTNPNPEYQPIPRENPIVPNISQSFQNNQFQQQYVQPNCFPFPNTMLCHQGYACPIPYQPTQMQLPFNQIRNYPPQNFQNGYSNCKDNTSEGYHVPIQSFYNNGMNPQYFNNSFESPNMQTSSIQNNNNLGVGGQIFTTAPELSYKPKLDIDAEDVSDLGRPSLTSTPNSMSNPQMNQQLYNYNLNNQSANSSMIITPNTSPQTPLGIVNINGTMYYVNNRNFHPQYLQIPPNQNSMPINYQNSCQISNRTKNVLKTVTNMTNKRPRKDTKRVAYNTNQKRWLEKEFEINNYITEDHRFEILEMNTELSRKQIKIWFQNQRKKINKPNNGY